MSKRAAKELVNDDLITIAWGDSMASAAKRMEKLKIRHLAVVDEQGEIVGILSDRDVQRAMNPTISLDDAGQGVYSEIDEFDPDARVRHYMAWPPKTVPANTDLKEVAALMVTEKISSLLVQDGDDTIGIITTEDLLKVLMSLLGHPQTRLSMDARSLLRMER